MWSRACVQPIETFMWIITSSFSNFGSFVAQLPFDERTTSVSKSRACPVCLSCFYGDSRWSLVFFCLSFSFITDKRVTAQINQRTHNSEEERDVTDEFSLDVVLLFGPFVPKSTLSSDVKPPPCPGRSAAPAIGRGRCTGPTRLICQLRWWGWLSQVTK